MSIQAIAWAMKQRTGNPACKGVLIALANFADENGHCWPTQDTIASMLEITDRTVRRALIELESKGLVQRKDRFKEGKRMSDWFTLNLDACAKPPDTVSSGESQTPADTMSGGPADTESKTTGHSRPKPADTVSAKPSFEPSKNHHIARADARKKIGISEFRLDEEAIGIAKKAGLSDDDIDALEIKFRAYNATAPDQTASQWKVHWLTWTTKFAAKNRKPTVTPADPAKLAGMFYARAGSPQLDAWQKALGNCLTDKAGGWLYPSEWPPGHDLAAKLDLIKAEMSR